MSKFRFPLNLQLFAGEQTVVVDGETFEIDDNERSEPIQTDDGAIEIPDEDDDLDEELEDEEDAEGTKDGTETKETTVKTEQQDKNPTANAVIQERKKWQAKLEEATKTTSKSNPLIEKMLKMTGLTNLDELQQHLDILEANQIAKDRGITPQQALASIEDRNRLTDMEKKLQKQGFDNEVKTLKADAFFADIEDYREEFEPIAARTGQTLEEVYMSKRGRVRMKEYETEVEQRLKNSQAKKNKVKIDPTPSGEGAKKQKIELTADERAIAKLAGISEADYYKNKKK